MQPVAPSRVVYILLGEMPGKIICEVCTLMTGSTYAILINIAVVLLKEDDPLASPSVEASVVVVECKRH